MTVIEDETKTPMCTIAVDFNSDPMITHGHDTIVIDKKQSRAANRSPSTLG